MFTAEYVRQLREIGSRIVVVDADTAPKLLEASTSLEWTVDMLSVGSVKVAGATSFQELLEDDGTGIDIGVSYVEYLNISQVPKYLCCNVNSIPRKCEDKSSRGRSYDP